MTASKSNPPAPPEHATPAQEALDRRIFQLTALLDASRELAGQPQPSRILETALLSCLGALGIRFGAAVLMPIATIQATVVHRGMTAADVARLDSRLPQLGQALLSAGLCDEQVRRLDPLPDACRPLLPAEAETLLGARLNDDYLVLLLFGPRHDDQPFCSTDQALLLVLGNTAASALRQAIANQQVQMLNADLRRQNASLQEALQQIRRAHRSLDRLAYQQKALYDTVAGLVPVADLQPLIENYLLMALGALGIDQGFVVVYDRSRQHLRQTARGLPPDWRWPADRTEDRFYAGLQATRQRLVPAMQVAEIPAPQHIWPASEMGLTLHSAWIFNVDDTLWGLVGLGAPLPPNALGDEERALLQGITANLLVFIKKIRAFETIQSLNADLERRNAILRRTITDLTEARRQVRLLERAKTRIRQLARRELDRVWRFRWRDASLMLLTAAALALIYNVSNPNGVPLVPEVLLRPAPAPIDALSAHALFSQGAAVIIDARPPELFARRHVAQAENVPASLFDLIFPMKIAARLKPEAMVIVYGRTISRPYDREVAYRVSQRHPQVRILAGGMAAWQQHGFPISP
jgi:rhodanese-related sulfurtransferase